MFWDLGVISMIDEHWGAFTCWTSTLAVFVISDPFNGLLLNVLWSQTISMVVKPQYVLTCWSSRLAVWADSGPFLGLLLTVLGSQSDFHD